MLKEKEGKVVKDGMFRAGKDPLDWKLEDGTVQGWYPIGYGKQPLYDIEISLVDEVRIMRFVIGYTEW